MRFIPHTERDVEQMLDAIGVPNLEALFSAIPEKLRLGRPLAVPEALSEQELQTIRADLEKLRLKADIEIPAETEKRAAELKAKGAEFTMEPNDIRPGTRIAFLRGPEGVSIELLERTPV